MERLERYIEEYSQAGTEVERALLAELDRATNLRVIQPKMVSGPAQGAFLTLIAKMLRPRLVLEIGTFTGYSALAIAAGLDDDAEIHTIEIDDELEEIARSFFDRSPHGHKIHLHIGSALEVVPKLAERLELRKFDLIYIDGDKREYPDYYRMVMGEGSGSGMVYPGSIIFTDNVLWYGKVVEQNTEGELGTQGVETDENGIRQTRHDRHTEGIVEFNRMVVADPRVENVIVPLRDGLNLIRVK
jgi:caffeoyl-CoA O-methyltransferase